MERFSELGGVRRIQCGGCPPGEEGEPPREVFIPSGPPGEDDQRIWQDYECVMCGWAERVSSPKAEGDYR